jgi:hypothetical protein
MAAGVAAGAVLFIGKGLPSRFSPDAAKLFAGAKDYSPRRRECHSDGSHRIPYQKNCVFGAAGATPDVIVWGDSHGVELSQALGEQLAPRGRAILESTSSSCPPAVGFERKGDPSCILSNDKTFESVKADARIRTVVLVADYDGYGDPAEIVKGVGRTAEGLVRAGKRVIVTKPLPLFQYDPPAALGMITIRGEDPETFVVPRADYDRENAEAAALLDELGRRADVVVFDPSKVLCTTIACRSYDRSAGVLYFNRNHLSVAGARMVARSFPIEMLAYR